MLHIEEAKLAADRERLCAQRDEHQFEIAVLVLTERGHRVATVLAAWLAVLEVANADRRRARQMLRAVVERRDVVEYRDIEITIWNAGASRPVLWGAGALPLWPGRARAVAKRPRWAWWRRLVEMVRLCPVTRGP